jgi:hypothetical protein
MPSHGKYIATRVLTRVDSAGKSFQICIGIGQPYQISRDEWACPVDLDGLHSGLRDQHGVDSFQVLNARAESCAAASQVFHRRRWHRSGHSRGLPGFT